MTHPIIYVSGPISAPHAHGVERNIRAAEDASARLFAAGVTNICVHSMCRFMDGLLGLGAAGHAKWMEHDLAILRRCDALYVCVEDYAASRGTMQEIEFCREQGIPVFYVEHFHKLVAWTRRTGEVAA